MRPLAGQHVTTVPLLAPAGPVTSLGFPFVKERQGLPPGAWFQATGSSYLVTFAACSPVFSPRVHTIVGTACNAATANGAEQGGSTTYGATGYKTHTDALAAPDLKSGAPKGPSVPVVLGYGMTGREYTTGGGEVTWRSGQWRFTANFVDCTSQTRFSSSPYGLVPTAKAIVALVRSQPLPNGLGLVSVTNNCGDDTSYWGSATWVEGAALYSTFALDSYSVPISLAARMRPYPPA